MLRFITCGSVDDGKSTLIGRLLYDSKLVFEDHLAALEADSRKRRHPGRRARLRPAGRRPGRRARAGHHHRRGLPVLLHRARASSSWPTRPGHEQYTRNMVTGASTAELAVILIDARKGVLTQTRRHSYLVSLLGIRHVVLAVNKLDLVRLLPGGVRPPSRPTTGPSPPRSAWTTSTASRCRRCGATTSPSASPNTPWYTGPTLLGHLETVEVDDERSQASRSGCRCSGSTARTSTSAASAGQIVGGAVRPGDPVRVLPSGRETHGRAHRHRRRRPRRGRGGPVGHAHARRRDRRQPRRRAGRRRPIRPRWPTSSRPTSSGWARTPMLPGRPYLLKIGTRTVGATARPAEVQGQRQHPRARGGEDARAQRDRRLQRQPRPARSPSTPTRRTATPAGSSSSTGYQRHRRRRAAALRPAAAAQRPLAGPRGRQGRARARSRASSPAVVWFTGLSGAGKSTIANLVERKLHAAGPAHLPARRRQRPPRPEQGPRLHRRRPGREHPPRRRGGAA